MVNGLVAHIYTPMNASKSNFGYSLACRLPKIRPPTVQSGSSASNSHPATLKHLRKVAGLKKKLSKADEQWKSRRERRLRYTKIHKTALKISSSRSYGAMKSKNLWPSSLSFLYEGGQERGTAVSVYSQL